MDNLSGVFYHFDLDVDKVVVHKNSSSLDAETQTTEIHVCKPDEVSDNIEVNEPLRIQQDQNFDECPHCFLQV